SARRRPCLRPLWSNRRSKTTWYLRNAEHFARGRRLRNAPISGGDAGTDCRTAPRNTPRWVSAGDSLHPLVRESTHRFAIAGNLPVRFHLVHFRFLSWFRPPCWGRLLNKSETGGKRRQTAGFGPKFVRSRPDRWRAGVWLRIVAGRTRAADYKT